MDSFEIVILVDMIMLCMIFDYFVVIEVGWDGGNVKVSVNGGVWQVVKVFDFVYNVYNMLLQIVVVGNMNLMVGEFVFLGLDVGLVIGLWGCFIINLVLYVKLGDKVCVCFELGNDGCGGFIGWYLDDVNVYCCMF